MAVAAAAVVAARASKGTTSLATLSPREPCLVGGQPWAEGHPAPAPAQREEALLVESQAWPPPEKEAIDPACKASPEASLPLPPPGADIRHRALVPEEAGPLPGLWAGARPVGRGLLVLALLGRGERREEAPPHALLPVGHPAHEARPAQWLLSCIDLC